MLGEVNQLGGFSDAAEGGLGDGVRLAGDGDDAAVMVGVAFAVEEIHARDFAHGGDDGVNFGQIAAFGKIWNRFDESFHVVKDSSRG